MTDERILEIAHRTATRYTHRSDPNYHSYGFVKHTLLDFARKVLAEVVPGGLPPMTDQDVKLPEPTAWVLGGFNVAAVVTTHPNPKATPVFTAEQVRAAVLAEREKSAKVCDQEVQRLSELGEHRAALAVGICAAAIRKG